MVVVSSAGAAGPRQLTDDELATARVKPDMIRLCIGIEHIDDIIADLDQALAASQG